MSVVSARPSARHAAIAALGALCVVAAPPPDAHAAPGWVNISPGIPGSFTAGGVAEAADGRVWATDARVGGGVLRVLSGGATGFTAGFSTPTDLVAGPDGNLWATQPSTGGLVRIPPGTGIPTAVPLGIAGAAPRGIAVGPDGALWVADGGTTPAILRHVIGGGVTAYTAGLTGVPLDLVPGPDGAVWFTTTGPAGLGRISTSGVITMVPTGLAAGNTPKQITVDEDGMLWVAVNTGGIPKILRVSTAGQVDTFGQSLPISTMGGIAAMSDARVYFALESPPRVGYVTSTGATTVYGNVQPMGITAMASGAPPLRRVMWAGGGAAPRVGWMVGGAEPEVSAPTAVAGDSPGSVRIEATVTPNGAATAYTVEYGPTSAFGSSVGGTVSRRSSSPGPFSAPIGGLAPATQYHARITLTNLWGTTTSTETAFVTPAASEPDPAPTPVPIPDLPAAPGTPPEQGSRVSVVPESGLVRVRTPGARTFIAISSEGASVPVGSVVDAERGRITLTSALPEGGRQSGTFWGSRFSVRQRRAGDGTVTIATDRRPLTGCDIGTAAEAATRRRTLWGKDDRGRYRTQGHNSVATVRGTVWATTETCGGTVTRVITGSVSVRDLRARRTVLVRAGGRYVARR